MAIHNITFSRLDYIDQKAGGGTQISVRCSCGYRIGVEYDVSQYGVDADVAVRHNKQVNYVVNLHKLEVALAAHGITFSVPHVKLSELPKDAA